MNAHTHIIYAGGTFGSHGVPLSPLAAEQFLPILQTQLAKKLPEFTTNILPNSLIKDSSTLTPADFVALYSLIVRAYADGGRRFVLITGTDSLSFLAAFLANAFADLSDISLVVTGSMQPLFVADNPVFTINERSDAWANLSGAIKNSHAHTGVFVQFYDKLMHAHDTQKINSQSHDAFVGTLAKSIQTNDKNKTDQTVFNDGLMNTTLANNAITDKLAQLPTLAANTKHAHITAVYCLPNDMANLEHQLTHLHPHTQAVILIGFGAGNVPSSQGLMAILDKLHSDGVRVIGTTMCAFGGTSTDYAAGAWQYQHGVEMSGLGIAGIYGQTLWQVLQ